MRSGSRTDGWATAILAMTMAVVVAPRPARGQTLPAVQLVTAPMVSPTTAWTHYGTLTTHTIGVAAWPSAPPEIVALSRSLGAGRTGVTATQYSQNVFDYVRNNIAIEFHFGLAKGGRGALIDQSGTAFDQAELMVKLLRQGGVTASYKVGTIALTTQQFGQWSGFIGGLDQVHQTFTVNAQSACQFLADGAIPAVVNGSSNCSTLSGNLPTTGTPVTMGHIWVQANGNLYDPAFKSHTFKAGVNLAQALACGTTVPPTCTPTPTPATIAATLTTAVMTGATTGTLGPDAAPTAQNLNETGTEAQLKTYAQNVQAYIQANAPAADLDDIVGGSRTDITYQPAVGPTLPYLSTAQYTWTGDIPDQFRSTLALQYQTINQTFFSDESASRRLRVFVDYLFAAPNNPNQTNYGTAKLFVDDTLIQSAACTACTNTISNTLAGGSMTLTAAHPYAGGTFANQTIVAPYFEPATVIQTWGESSPSTEQFYTGLQQGDPSPFVGSASAPTASCESAIVGLPASHNPGFNYWTGCRGDEQPTLVGMLHAQRSAANSLVATLSGAPLITHHTVGVLSASQGVATGPSFLGPPEYQTSSVASVSIESTTGLSASRSSAFDASSAIYSVLEGSVGQQSQDVPEGGSAIAGLIEENRAALQFVAVSPSAMTATLPSMNYGAPGSYEYTQLENGAAAGLTFILPSNPVVTPPPPAIPQVYLTNFGYSANQLTYLIQFTLKGGGASGDPDPAGAVLKTAKAAEAGKAKKYLGVDLASGDVTLTPPPDITTGAGDFPLSLPFQRFYESGSGASEVAALSAPLLPNSWTWQGPDQDDFARLGGGWTHNYQITARIGSDGLKAMGRDDALDAAAVIAGTYALNSLLTSPTVNQRYASFMTTYWLGGQLVDNIVTVTKPPSQIVFQKLPVGGFNPPPGSADILSQSYARTGPTVYLTPPGWIFGGIEKYDYSLVQFNYTDRAGSTISFNTASQLQNYTQTTVASWGEPFFKATQWNFPDGNSITFNYGSYFAIWGSANTFLSFTRNYLTNVTNSLGRQLSFSSNQTGLYCNGLCDDIAIGWGGVNGSEYDVGRVITAVTDENSRQVTFALSNCPPIYLNNGGGQSQVTGALACPTLKVTNPDTAISTYSYAPGSDSPNPPVITRDSYRLRRWFTADNLTTPFQTVLYDGLFRAATVTDILGHANGYYSSALFQVEWWKRSDQVDPIGNVSTSWFDEWKDLTQSTDPLGRTTTYAYDSLRRKVLETRPEGDQTTTAYDVRSNVVQQTQIAKPGSPLTTTVTGATYEEGPTVAICVNPVICNKPATTFDALAWVLSGGNPGPTQVTSLTYNFTTGQTTQIRKPADSSGNRPETDLTYTTFQSLPGVSFLTGKTQWISLTQYTTTNYAYKSGNKYVLLSATVDPTGLNLATTFAFDAVGNLTGVTDPRANVTNYTWDANRRLIFAISPPITGLATQVAVKNTYDLDDQLIEVDKGTAINGLGGNFTALESTTQTYDAAGNQVQNNVLNGTSTPALKVTQKTYDADDRPKCSAVRMNPAVFGSLPASACTQSTTGAYGPDQITQFIYDGASQKLMEQRGVGSPTPINYATWTWSLDGAMASVKDANGNTIYLGYDGFNRLSTVTHPDSSTETSQYDADGDLTIWTNRGGFAIVRCYDALHRKISEVGITGATNVGACPTGGTANNTTRSWDIQSRTFAYDLMGRRTSASEHQITMTWAYDLAGRPTGRGGNWTTSYGWDGAGNMTSVTYPGGSGGFTYVYDAMNRMSSALSGASTLATLTYDSLGRRSAIAFGDSSRQTYGYDGADRVTSLAHAFPNTPDNDSLTYAYDPADQETSRSGTNGAYDWSPTVATVAYATANALNQYPSVAAYPYSYWPEGPLEEDDQRKGYYDENNQLTLAYITTTPGVIDPNHYQEGVIDPLGHLMFHNILTTPGTNPEFYHSTDGLRPENVLDWQYTVVNGSATFQGYRRYVLGPNPDERLAFLDMDGTLYYPHTDREGSAIALSASGAAVQKYHYGPYGESTDPLTEIGPGSTTYGYRYTGQRLDPSTNLYDYKARNYSIQTGRFLQPDPAGVDEGPNLYEYVGDNPINHDDPTGLAGVIVSADFWIATGGNAGYASFGVAMSVDRNGEIQVGVVESKSMTGAGLGGGGSAGPGVFTGNVKGLAATTHTGIVAVGEVGGSASAKIGTGQKGGASVGGPATISGAVPKIAAGFGVGGAVFKTTTSVKAASANPVKVILTKILNTINGAVKSAACVQGGVC